MTYDEWRTWVIGTLLVCRERNQRPFLCKVVLKTHFGMLVTDESGGVGEVMYEEADQYGVVDDGYARDFFEQVLLANLMERRAGGGR